VIGDREPVCFITHPLQQIQAVAVARHDDRVGLRWHPHLLEALGQSDHGDVRDAEVVEHGLGRVHLRGAAVDHVQVGRVGEPT
jgi:hypothetical protein